MLCAGNQRFQIYRLWFDVGIKKYTTQLCAPSCVDELWFDVGIKKYTTENGKVVTKIRCGLM